MASEKKPMMYKQVIVLRTDLGMSKGKLIAQGAHVSVGASFLAFHKTKEIFDEWMKEGHTRIICKARSLEELKKLEYSAAELEITYMMVEDLGRTELAPGTITAIAIGPDLSERVDEVTGSLKLL